MNTWYYAWMAIFAFSTVAFAVIAVVVVIRGSFDLSEMLRGLAARREPPKSD